LRASVATALLILVCLSPAGYAAVESAAPDAFALLMAARNAQKMGAYDRALTRYQRLIEQRPDWWEARTEYGWLLIKLGKPKEALDQFAVAVRGHPARQEVHEQYIKALLALKHLTKAEEALRAYRALNPSETSLRRLEASLALLQLRYPVAARLFRALDAEAISRHDAALHREAAIGLVDVFTATGRHDRAGEILGELQQAFSGDADILHKWVLNQAMRGRLIEAYTDLPKIQDPVLHDATEAGLLNLTGRHFAAETRYRALLTTSPLDDALLIGLADSFHGRGQEKKAADVYRDMIRLFPEHLQAKLDLAETYTEMRQYDPAEQMIGEVLEHDPENLHARYLQTRLCSLRKEHGCAGSNAMDVIQSVETLEDGRALATVMRDRHHDFEGLIALGEHLLRDKSLYERSLLADYVHAIIVTGRPRQGAALVSSLLDRRDTEPPYLALLLAELAWLEGNRAQTDAWLHRSPDRVEKAALFYRLKDYQKAVQVCRTILRDDPDDLQAFVWLVKSLVADAQEEAAHQALSAWLEGKPRGARLALASMLATAPDARGQYYDVVHERWADLVQDAAPDDMDLRLSRLALLSSLKQYSEAIAGYRSVLAADPQFPRASLQIARLFAQSKDVEGTQEAYGDHLQRHPHDLPAWREKARALSWAGKLDRARDEYQAIIAANPAHEEVALEYDAKNALWRGRYRRASSSYDALLAREPDNAEALFDSGQILLDRLQPEEARRYYRRVLARMPGHREAALGIRLSELSQSPQGIGGMGYVNMRGSGPLFAPLSISYLPATAEGEMSLSNNLAAGLGYQHVSFDMNQGPSVSHVGRLSLRYSPSASLHVDGAVTGLLYPDISRQNINFGAGVSYEGLSGVRMRADAGRQDLWQNRTTIRSGMFFDYYSLGADLSATDRIDLSVGGGYWRYSDKNENLNGQFGASYKILQFPHLLRLIYNLETLKFSRDVTKQAPPPPGVYFSPDRFAKHNFAVEFRHAWGYPASGDYFPDPPRNRWSLTALERFMGWPTKQDYLARNTYSLSYGPAVDSFNNLYHQANATFSHAITSRLFIHTSASLIRANVFNMESVNAYLEYRF